MRMAESSSIHQGSCPNETCISVLEVTRSILSLTRGPGLKANRVYVRRLWSTTGAQITWPAFGQNEASRDHFIKRGQWTLKWGYKDEPILFVSLALISLATCELFIDIYTTFQSQTGSCQRDFSRTAHCHWTLALDCDIDLLVEDSEERIGRVVDLLR